MAKASHVIDVYSNRLFCFKPQLSLVPFFQTALFCILLALPITVVPYLFLWVYDKLIWLSEPVFLTIEAVEVVRVSVRTSSRVAEQIDEQPLLMKVLTFELDAIIELEGVLCTYAVLTRTHFHYWRNLYTFP